MASGSSLTLFYAGLSGSTWSIGRATGDLGSPTSLTGRVQVLAPTAGTYDAGGLRDPVVWVDGLTWRMWYTAIDDSGAHRLASASSANGVTWTKTGLAMDRVAAGYDMAEGGIDAAGVIGVDAKPEVTFSGSDRFGWSRVGVAAAVGPGYVESGSASYELDNPAARDWRKLAWNPAAQPAGGSAQVWVSYYPTFSGEWSAYFPVSNNLDLPFLLTVQRMRWQVRLSSTTASVSPQLDDLTVNHAPVSFPTSGQAVTKPVGPPAGKYLLTWTSLTASADVASGTSLSVSVQDEGGLQLLPPQTINGVSATISLAGLPATSGRLVAVFSLAGSGAATPKLTGVGVDYTTTNTPSAMTLNVTKAKLTYGGSATVSGKLTSGASALGGQPVTISARTTLQQAYTTLSTVTTKADGTFLLAVKPAACTVYKASWPGATIGATLYPPALATRRIDVSPALSLTLSNFRSLSGKYRVYPFGRRVIAKGRVTPSTSSSAVRRRPAR